MAWPPREKHRPLGHGVKLVYAKMVDSSSADELQRHIDEPIFEKCGLQPRCPSGILVLKTEWLAACNNSFKNREFMRRQKAYLRDGGLLEPSHSYFLLLYKRALVPSPFVSEKNEISFRSSTVGEFG